MASNSRFAIAIHTLGVLAVVGESPVSSEMIAGSVDTNPVVIRRIIKKLEKFGIVEVRMGTGGGSRLTRSPSEISLAQIYAALEEEVLFQSPALAEEHGCPVGKAVRPVLTRIFSDVEEKLLVWLEDVTLMDVMDSVSKSLSQGKSTVSNKC